MEFGDLRSFVQRKDVEGISRYLLQSTGDLNVEIPYILDSLGYLPIHGWKVGKDATPTPFLADIAIRNTPIEGYVMNCRIPYKVLNLSGNLGFKILLKASCDMRTLFVDEFKTYLNQNSFDILYLGKYLQPYELDLALVQDRITIDEWYQTRPTEWEDDLTDFDQSLAQLVEGITAYNMSEVARHLLLWELQHYTMQGFGISFLRHKRIARETYYKGEFERLVLENVGKEVFELPLPWYT